MYKSSKYLIWSGVVLSCLISMCSPVQTKAQEWKQYADPVKEGWSEAELEAAREYAAKAGSGAVMIVERGNVVAAWGHIDFPFKAASIRKSIYDATFGAEHYKKKFDVNATLESLKVEDLQELTGTEKTATYEHLMTARSGVYHPAAYETASNAERRPERGSARPGTFWYYNNWDYNLTTEVFERLSGKSFRSAFFENIANPLGLEDIRDRHLFEWLEPRSSMYPANTMRMSARDLGRIGKLYLQKGEWNGKRIVAREWVARSTMPITVFEKDHYRGEGNGYGRMWWVFPAHPESISLYRSHNKIAASGAGGQIMVLFPEIELMIVHLSDTDTGRGVRENDVIKMMDMILAARKKRTGKSALGPVKIKVLSPKEPVPLRDDYSLLPEAKIELLTGTYMFTDELGMKLYRFEERLFLQPIGMPFPDAEAFEVTDGTLRNPLVNLVIKVTHDGDKPVREIELTFGGRTMKGQRKEL